MNISRDNLNAIKRELISANSAKVNVSSGSTSRPFSYSVGDDVSNSFDSWADYWIRAAMRMFLFQSFSFFHF